MHVMFSVAKIDCVYVYYTFVHTRGLFVVLMGHITSFDAFFSCNVLLDIKNIRNDVKIRNL